jgi:hypothetical protein
MVLDLNKYLPFSWSRYRLLGTKIKLLAAGPTVEVRFQTGA